MVAAKKGSFGLDPGKSVGYNRFLLTRLDTARKERSLDETGGACARAHARWVVLALLEMLNLRPEGENGLDTRLVDGSG